MLGVNNIKLVRFESVKKVDLIYNILSIPVVALDMAGHTISPVVT